MFENPGHRIRPHIERPIQAPGWSNLRAHSNVLVNNPEVKASVSGTGADDRWKVGWTQSPSSTTLRRTVRLAGAGGTYQVSGPSQTHYYTVPRVPEGWTAPDPTKLRGSAGAAGSAVFQVAPSPAVYSDAQVVAARRAASAPAISDRAQGLASSSTSGPESAVQWSTPLAKAPASELQQKLAAHSTGAEDEAAVANLEWSSPKPSASSCRNCSPPKLCLRGACVCPAALTGPDCTEAKKEFSGCASLLKNGDWATSKTPLHSMANWTTCAVVGNAAASTSSGLMGARIDAHSAVIRFNEAPTRAFQRQVGSKTTLRMQNRDHCGFREVTTEMCMFYSATQRPSQGNLQCLRKMQSAGCRPVMPSAEARQYAAHYWKRASSPDNAPVCSGKETHENRNSEGSPLKCKSSKVSSGFMGILMAVQLCAEVDIYRFESSGNHYYRKSKYLGSQSFADRHFWAAERQCRFQKLEKLKGVTKY